MIFGLLNLPHFVKTYWPNLVHGNPFEAFPMIICLLLIPAGYGILRQHKWARIFALLLMLALIVACLSTLFLLLAKGNRSIFFWITCFTILAAAYTSYLVLCSWPKPSAAEPPLQR